MTSKFYLYTSKSWAQKLVDELTIAYGENIPYTEIRESNNGKGYAIRADEFTETVTDKEPQDLPIDFYLEEITRL